MITRKLPIAEDSLADIRARSPDLSGGAAVFWTNTLGTVYASDTDIFAAETLGNARPGVGNPLQ